MDIGKILDLINRYGPAGQSVLQLLGPEQKAWLNYNMSLFAPFLHTSSGQDSLVKFLADFQVYVNAERAKGSD